MSDTKEQMFMPIVPLGSQAAVYQELMSMPPLAQEACKMAVSRIPDIQNIKANRMILVESVIKSIAVTGMKNGVALSDIDKAVELHARRILVVVYSVLALADEAYVSRGSGFGRVAALGAGILVGILIG